MSRLVLLLSIVLASALGCGQPKATESAPQKTAEAPGPSKSEAPVPSGPKEPGPADPKKVAPADPKGAGDNTFKLTAVDLAAEIKKDRKAAQTKYKDATIELSGTVRSTAPIYYAPGSSIDLASADPFAGVLCTTKDVVPPETLARGQTVRVRGKWSDRGPVLVDCVVIERGPDTAIRTTAEQIAKDCAGEMDKVREKYEKRTIVIKGTVAAVKGDPNVPIIKFVELKGDGQTVVECRFGSSGQESKLPDKYKAGDAAIFVGELTRVEKGRFVVGPCYPAQSSDPSGKK